MKFIAKLFANALAVFITAYILPGVHVGTYIDALVVAVVLALLNMFIKPLLIIFTIPVTIMTFGLFLIVINVIIIFLADKLIDGFSVDGFWWAVLFSLVLSLINALFNQLEGRESHENQS